MTTPKKDEAKVPTNEDILKTYEDCCGLGLPIADLTINRTTLLALLEQARLAGRREGLQEGTRRMVSEFSDFTDDIYLSARLAELKVLGLPELYENGRLLKPYEIRTQPTEEEGER